MPTRIARYIWNGTENKVHRRTRCKYLAVGMGAALLQEFEEAS
jgi:hypothetical protein